MNLYGRYSKYKLDFYARTIKPSHLEVVPEVEWEVTAALVYWVVARHSSTLLKHTIAYTCLL